MPVTKTAKRALRSSKRKERANKITRTNLEVAVRLVKKEKSKITLQKAFSAIDRAAKKGILPKNKAARIKSSLSKLLLKSESVVKKNRSKKPRKSSTKK